MTDERFDALMRDAATTYNTPPDLPPLDEMWQNIAPQLETRSLQLEPRKRFPVRPTWLLMAATLILGLALGRASSMMLPAAADQERSVMVASTNVQDSYDATTSEYLGQAAAMLVALPGQLNSRQSNPNYFAQLEDLLLQTRLLMDSPAGDDPALHALLEDLEVVLIQVVRLQADRDPIKIELLHDALERRDVMPRLRNAVVSQMGD